MTTSCTVTSLRSPKLSHLFSPPDSLPFCLFIEPTVKRDKARYNKTRQNPLYQGNLIEEKLSRGKQKNWSRDMGMDLGKNTWDS